MFRSTSHRAAAVLAGILLSGCSPAALGPAPVGGEVSLRVSPRFQAEGYAAQAVIAPYTVDDVAHVVLSLYKLDGNTELPVKNSQDVAITLDVPRAELGHDVVFTKLKANTTYRIKAQAYKAAGTSVADLISTADSASYVDVAIGENDRPAVALTVKLKDQVFSGTVTLPEITLTNGGYTASDSVSVTIVP
ncbi:hypothetical protein J7643_12410 [bacterium]|nr:hypothetical protein [bacterium]